LSTDLHYLVLSPNMGTTPTRTDEPTLSRRVKRTCTIFKGLKYCTLGLLGVGVIR
jgi:hypothetical protein